MLTKPTSCQGCTLYTKGIGFNVPYGPDDAEILIVGECLDEQEAKQEKPLVGGVGSILNKALKYVGIDSKKVKFHNIVSCQPPKLGDPREIPKVAGMPWEKSAVDHCAQYIDKTIIEGNYKVVISLGPLPSKQMLGLYGKKGVSIFDLHGAPAKDKTGKFWVVPAIHPSYILQGHWSFFGVLCFDLLRALEISRDGWDGDKSELIIDPGYARFDGIVRYIIKKAEASKNGLWLAVDIETPFKSKNIKEENTSIGINPLDTIHRINFSYDKNLGYTIPFDEQHLPGIKLLLAHPKIKKSFWNMNFDKPNLEAAGVPVLEPAYDMMYGFHFLQSDVRMGLGFVAPFFSMYGPWKHLTDHTIAMGDLSGTESDNYKIYSAVDGIQTIRCTYGIERDLKNVGLWESFERHVRDLDRFALRPAEKIGLLFDREKLENFQQFLCVEEEKLSKICTKFAPKEIIPWAHEWKTCKAAMSELGVLKPGHFEITELTMCYVCQNCKTINVNKTHTKTKKCKDAELKFEEHKVTKWVQEGIFNPNSPKQVLSYIKSQKHKPGKQKKGEGDTSDVNTLENLRRQHQKDPMYPALLQMRKITKMKGTYCDGILERLDKKNRVHSSYCLTGDHEVLTKNGWVRLDEYNKIDPIAQWNKNKSIDFIKPFDFVEEKYSGDLIEYFGHYLDITATPNHRIPYNYFDSKIKKDRFKVNTIDNLPQQVKIPLSGYLISGQNTLGDFGKLVIAIQADGSIRENRITFNLKKPRKIIRLLEILNNLKIKYTLTNIKDGCTRFRFPLSEVSELSDWLIIESKTFKQNKFLELNIKSINIALKEFTLWDGYSKTYTIYCSKNKINVSLVQTLLHCNGMSSSIKSRTGGFSGSGIVYYVFYSNKNNTQPKTAIKNITGVKNVTVYCPSVNSEFFIVKRNDKIYITGNTHIPATLRLSSKNPNLTNLVSKDKKEDENAFGKRFRECVIPDKGCKLLEADFGGIEAVETGWFAKDPEYMRLAKLSVHSYLTTHLVKKPADLAWSDEDLIKYFSKIKKQYFIEYNKAKRVVHGCLTPGHEVLTKNGWINIEDLKEGIEIAQWDEDTEISFVIPKKIHSYQYHGDIYKKYGKSLSLETTPNHRFPIYKSSAGPLNFTTEARQIEEGIDWRVPTSGNYISGNKDPMTAYEKLSIAAQADGTMCSKNHVRFHMTKERKISRLEFLLEESKTKYSKISCKCHPKGFRIAFSLDEKTKLINKHKKFKLDKILKLSYIGRKDFLEEVLHWDGNRTTGHNTYLTTDYDNAVIVQTIAHLTNRQGLLRVQTNREASYGNKPLYTVSFNRRTKARLGHLEIDDIIEKVETPVYCVTVPSSWFLVKHNDRISITGNSSYGLSAMGLHLTYPELFPTKKDAQEVQDIFFNVASKVHAWQNATIKKADQQRYLGGLDHPFHYKHWFYNVIVYTKISESKALYLRKKGVQVLQGRGGVWYQVKHGVDAKRCIAFYPQSTAGGVLKESMLRLFDPASELYIGDIYYGETPLRAPIHDSILLEVPNAKVDFVTERVYTAMTSPIKQQPMDPTWNMGEFLTINVDIEVGSNWATMEKIKIN